MHGFETRGELVPRGRFVDTGRFGRMFPHLRSLKRTQEDILALAQDPRPDGSRGVMVGPGQPNPRIKAGYTFLGQFIDHDLTLDATSLLEQQIDLNATTNFRTPALELDSLYGRGPNAQPVLYQKDSHGMFLLNKAGDDMQRNSEGRALIGDPRNDENRIVNQLHVLFLKFHNRVLATEAAGASDQERFEEAQRIVRWHYQWIVLHEFLPRIVGGDFIADVLDATDPEAVGPAYMPVEFSGAAFRFGHSMIRAGYVINDAEGAGLFPDRPDAAPSDRDLRGGRDFKGKLIVDWKHFFGETPLPEGSPEDAPPISQPSMRIDTKISPPLLNLPNGVVPASLPIANPVNTQRSLVGRNLIRGLDLRLPAGETIADFLEIARLPPATVWEDLPEKAGLTPLWFYILKEAEVLHDGQHLGGVGAAIVAQTFVNILLADKASFLNNVPAWTPELASGGTFTMADLANFTLGTSIPNETLDLAAPAPPRPAPAGTA